MGKNALVLSLALLLLLILFRGVSSAPTTSSPAKIVSGFFSNALSAFMKWLWSLKPTTKTAITGRPMMKFEGGYTVETVFDGSKLGIEPHTVEVLPSGELLILDSANSNLYRISASLSLYNRPRLVAGSPEGYTGHVDGKPREARMNHPKGIAVDDRGNIYIADTMNMAIRKISDAESMEGHISIPISGYVSDMGASRKIKSRSNTELLLASYLIVLCTNRLPLCYDNCWRKMEPGRGHVDGPSEDAKFSNDFDVVYVGSSCSLLVIDRGNRAIKEIQLHFDDCAYQYRSGFPLGIAVLVAAGFFGYMLALLQRRVGTIVSSQNDQESVKVNAAVSSLYQKPLKSVRPPLIPIEDELEKQEEGFFGSLGNLFVNCGVSALEILGGVFPVFRKKSQNYQYPSLHRQQQQKHSMPWPAQESFVIPDEDEPPSIDTRAPTPRKTYPFMSKDAEKIYQLRQSRVFYSGWDADMHHQQHQQQKQQHQQQKQQQQQQQQQQHRYQSSAPHTYYEQSHEKTNEIVFGAVQEQHGKREAMALKPVDHGDNTYDRHNIRLRSNSGFSRGY